MLDTAVCILKNILCIYLFIYLRERAQAGEGGREREEEADSLLRREPR